ncbi:ribosomal-processing cysteine protease Prp [Finegoldia sp. BIOML-A2]|uniref:Ribosomal processing cysteine protease Prp n=1 Tax=Finegoldia magna TaxID=1260 RepID=A0A6N3APA9_FINMA|nr:MULTISPECIES: ribosomal-processing cysteine protease Prp [unclassified Finegoldia]MSA97561.1 ribosomal-processing cysteine protease Prp [Finegoldia sp. BIOML-A5]MSB01079.1 ribosomal-processing cysteine protease Prp [Finegoldia sp. BIOML-A2]
MVTVDIFRKDKKFVKVKSTGHADHGSYGNDVVCSAISVYLINTVNTFTEILKLDSDKLKFHFESGDAFFEINYDLLNETEMIQVDILMKSLVFALESIRNENIKHLKINYREV